MIRYLLFTLLLVLLLMTIGCGHSSGGVDIWDAVERGDSIAIQTFADSGGDLNIRALDGTTPLWTALSNENRDSYEALLVYGADPNVIMSGKRVVTHWAATKDDPWWLRLALEHGADPDLVNVGAGAPVESGPLMFAISISSLDAVRLLIQHGANADLPNEFGCYPLTQAAEQNDFDIVLYLLDAGADYRIAKSRGMSFVACICQKDKYKNRIFKREEDRKKLDAVVSWR
jgi:ankyrin repeat protein